MRWLFLLMFAGTLYGEPGAVGDGLYKPTFLLDDRSFTAGTAFLTRVSVGQREELMLVTCFHVLGDSPSRIRAAVGLSMTQPQVVVVGSRGLPIEGAGKISHSSAAGEVAAFPVLDAPPNISVLRLAGDTPKVGEHVRLLARLAGSTLPQFYAAHVAASTRDYLEYVLDDAGLELGGTSGAPVVNEKGEVVGISVAGRKAGKELHAYANPTSTFVREIQNAWRSSNPQPGSAIEAHP